MTDLIVFEPDAEVLSHLRWLLGNEGYRVLEANEPGKVERALKTSEARWVVGTRATLESYPDLLAKIREEHPQVEVLAHPGYASAFLAEGMRGEKLASFARDALVLLGDLAEKNGGHAELTRVASRVAEATALQLKLERTAREACSLSAALASLGPALVPFRLGRREPLPEAFNGISDGLKAALTASEMLASPYRLGDILSGVEERFEGGGRPNGIRGAGIPLEARVVAVALRYARLLADGMSRDGAAEHIKQRMGSDFDPQVGEAFFRALRNETLISRLTGEGEIRGTVLLADADESALTLNEMRLSQGGFSVRVCRDGKEAFDLIQSSPPDVLVADMQLPTLDGVSLLLRLRRQDAAKRIPVILLAGKAKEGMIDKALKLGARDVLSKPVDDELLLAKLRALSSRKAGTTLALEGSIQQLALPDLFQSLNLGRRTCRAQVESPDGRGEVYFHAGQPTAAFTGERQGAEAFYEVVSWSEGSFRIISGEVPPEQNLSDGLHALLMRAAKVLDESRRNKLPE